MRLPQDEYVLAICEVVAQQSPCLRRNIGSVIVRGKQILVTGFNGPPSKMKHCTVCARANIPSGQRRELCRAVHAEQNAINFAARYGIAVEGATLYSTHYPCSWCAGSIVNAGIVKVVYVKDYPDPLTDEILSNIELVHYDPHT